MANAASSITRLAEILNGAATTQQELHQYLSPDAKQRFHVNEAVEARLRDLLHELMEREEAWKQRVVNLLRPWQQEIDGIVAAAQTAIINHVGHAKEPRCACFREQREALWELQDRCRGDREALLATEAAWDAMQRFSEAYEQPKDDPAAEALAALPDLVADSVECLLRDALPFLGRKRR